MNSDLWVHLMALSAWADEHEFEDSEAEDSMARGLESLRFSLGVESALEATRRETD